MYGKPDMMSIILNIGQVVAMTNLEAMQAAVPVCGTTVEAMLKPQSRTSARSLTMAIVAILEFPGASVEKYEKVFEVGGPQILNQPSRIHHVCYRTPDGFTVVDVWEDEASFAAFG